MGSLAGTGGSVARIQENAIVNGVDDHKAREQLQGGAALIQVNESLDLKTKSSKKEEDDLSGAIIDIMTDGQFATGRNHQGVSSRKSVVFSHSPQN